MDSKYLFYCLCFNKSSFADQREVLSVDDFAEKSFTGVCSGLAFSEDPKAHIINYIRSYVGDFMKMSVLHHAKAYDIARLGETIFKLLNSVCVFLSPVDGGFYVEAFSPVLSDFVEIGTSEIESINRAHDLFVSFQKNYSDIVSSDEVKDSEVSK